MSIVDDCRQLRKKAFSSKPFLEINIVCAIASPLNPVLKGLEYFNSANALKSNIYI